MVSTLSFVALLVFVRSVPAVRSPSLLSHCWCAIVLVTAEMSKYAARMLAKICARLRPAFVAGTSAMVSTVGLAGGETSCAPARFIRAGVVKEG